MGWWKINNVDSGAIDHTVPRKYGELLNARADDSPENYYNGDGPADAIDIALKDILMLCGLEVYSRDRISKIKLSEMKTLFFNRLAVGFLQNVPLNDLLDVVDQAWRNHAACYVEMWKRAPYEEEKTATFNFCLKGHFEG